MDFIKGIWDELKKTVTGTKNPKPKRLFYASIVILIIFIFGFFAHDFMEYLTSSPNIYVEKIQPYLEEDNNGKYLPVYFSNVGDKYLKNAAVNIKNCHMSTSRTYKYDLIAQHSNKNLIKFFDIETIQQLDKKDCTIRDQNTAPTCNVDIYSYQNKRFAPEQNCTFFVCSPCEYTVEIIGDNFNETLTSNFLSPFEYVFLASTVIEKNNMTPIYSNISRDNWIYNTTINIGITGQNEKCAKDSGDCDYRKSFWDWRTILEVEPYPQEKDSFTFVLREKYPNDMLYLIEMEKKGYKIIGGS